MGVSGPVQTATELQRALYAAAERAILAPSILNSQPWSWRVHRSSLELFADPDRQLHGIDPDRRLLTLSCGGALHHACVALRVRGLEPRVERAPDRTQPDLLALIRVAGPHAVTWVDRTEASSIGARVPVTARDVELLQRAADAHGARLHMVTTDQKPFLALAAASAEQMEEREESYQRDLAAWTDDRMRGEGIPRETLVSAAVPRTVPLRDFAGGGETGLHPGLGDDTYADYLILSTAADDPPDWLRGGEAMSAVWLDATARRIAATVISNVIEVPGARALVAGLLPTGGHPQIVLRIGIAAQPTPPPASPRRAPETVIHIDDRD
jgi:hypothetical protein